MSFSKNLRQLGQSPLHLSPIGLGVWQLSSNNEGLGGFWNPLDEAKANAVVDAAIKGGINWFDTAEAYGNGSSESHLANSLKAAEVKPDEISIADKWWPHDRKVSHLLESFPERLECLQGFPIDLYQIHRPNSLSDVKEEMKVMAQLVEEGKIKAVGVCNYFNQDLTQAYNTLKEHGIPLASVQVRYSLVNRSIEANGTLQAARDLGISVIAWGPLEGGLLTGRFHNNTAAYNSLSEDRKDLYMLQPERLKKTEPLIKALEELGRKYQVSPGVAALNWLIHFHNDLVFAIPGASNAEQAANNAKAMTFKLDDGELQELNKLSWRAIGISPRIKSGIRGLVAKFR